MQEGRDFFTSLCAGMGSQGYEEWMARMCKEYLNPMDRLFFERTAKAHMRFMRRVFGPLRDEGFAKAFTSVSLLEYARDSGMFEHYTKLFLWDFSLYGMRLPRKCALQMIIWLEAHHLLDLRYLFNDIVMLDFDDCIDYAIEQKWHLKAVDPEVQLVKSRRTFELFLKHNLISKDETLAGLFRNRFVVEWIMRNQHLDEYNLLDYIHSSPNAVELLLSSFDIEADPLLIQQVVYVIYHCEQCNDHAHLRELNCAEIPWEIRRFIPYHFCACDNAENHRLYRGSPKRLKFL